VLRHMALLYVYVRGQYKMKMEKQKITIIALAVLLVGALGFIGVGKYNDVKQQEQLGIFQQGAQYGCEQVPLRVENQTINMVAVDCLRQG